MNFDDIMNGGLGSLNNEDLGKDITDIFELNTEKVKNSVKDLMQITMGSEDSTDSDIIRMALLLCESKEETAVTMHLLLKALIGEVTNQANEMGELLDDTREVIEEIGGEFAEQYAMGMIGRMMARMGDDELNDLLGDDE